MAKRGRYGHNKRVVVMRDFDRVVAGAVVFDCPYCKSCHGQMRDYDGRNYYTCVGCKRRVLGTAYEPRCYDSEWEAIRGEELHWLQANDRIADLREHPKIKLPYCPRGWMPDFSYIARKDGVPYRVVEDVKGKPTREYILKRRIIVGEKGPAAIGCIYRESWYERGKLHWKDYQPSPERLMGVTPEEIRAGCTAIVAVMRAEEWDQERRDLYDARLESLLAKLRAVYAGEEIA